MSRVLTALLCCCCATTALAADVDNTVAQKDGWAAYAKELDKKAEEVNAKCGSKLAAAYDKSTYLEFDPLKDRTEAACKAAVGTLTALCATEAGKEAVKKLTKATCQFSTTGTGLSVSGTELVVKIDPVKSAIVGKQKGSYSWQSALKENL